MVLPETIVKKDTAQDWKNLSIPLEFTICLADSHIKIWGIP